MKYFTYRIEIIGLVGPCKLHLWIPALKRFVSLIIGVGLIQPEYFTKTLIFSIFIAISNPISSHALARGSHKAGIKPFSKTNFDAYANMKEKLEDGQ